jgi:hypothetical protein
LTGLGTCQVERWRVAEVRSRCFVSMCVYPASRLSPDVDPDQERRPNGLGFRLRRVTWKGTPSNQGCLLLVWLLLRRSTLTPVSLRGPAPNGHPCPDGALAASMRLGPLRETCVQPAPKSRLVSSGRLVFKDQEQIKQIKSFPAKAGPTGCTRCFFSGTGFSREGAGLGALSLCGSTRDRSHALRGNALFDAPRHPETPRDLLAGRQGQALFAVGFFEVLGLHRH